MLTRLVIETLRLSAAARIRRTLEPDAVTTVALIELTGLGDVISMLPAVHRFRALFPSADIHLLVDSTLVELLQSLQIPAAIHGIGESRRPVGVLSAVRLVRTLQPTLVCSMSPPRRNTLVTLASGAPCLAGYLRYTDSLAPYLLETPVEAYGLPAGARLTFGHHHISERALLVSRVLGSDADPAAEPVKIALPALNRVRLGLVGSGAIPGGDYVVIHPFAGWTYREWPLSSFAGLARRLIDECGTRVAFLCEEARDGNLASLRRQFAGSHSVTFSSSLTLLEAAALVFGASLFIGNDSGPLHLAAALGVPAVGLFGPSDPSLTAPRALATSSYLYERAECSPCDQRKCRRAASPCMNAIPVDSVFSAAVSVLRRPVHA